MTLKTQLLLISFFSCVLGLVYAIDSKDILLSIIKNSQKVVGRMAGLRWAGGGTAVCRRAETHSCRVSMRALVIGSHDRIIQLLQICWPHIHDAISCSTKELGNKS